MSTYWKTLLPSEPANFPYNLPSYGAELRTNKGRLLTEYAALTIKDERRALMTAMAMIETYNLSPTVGDRTKDANPDGSANTSLFNLNEYFLRQLGYSGKISLLNPFTALRDVIRLINKGFDTWGIVRTLNTVRGGQTGFNDGGKKYDLGYRNAVSTSLRLMDNDPSLLSDDRRVEMKVPYV